MLRVPPSLLLMIEPRAAKARMPGYSRYLRVIASISASISAARTGSAIMRTWSAPIRRVMYRTAGTSVSPRSNREGSAFTWGSSQASTSVPIFSIAARLYPGGAFMAANTFGSSPSGRYSAAGVISQITARLSKEVIAIQAKRRVGVAMVL